jgi:hypothetical protein
MFRSLPLLLSAVTLLAYRLAAQATAGSPLLTYIPGATAKLEQVIGDCDHNGSASARSSEAKEQRV